MASDLEFSTIVSHSAVSVRSLALALVRYSSLTTKSSGTLQRGSFFPWRDFPSVHCCNSLREQLQTEGARRQMVQQQMDTGLLTLEH